MQPTTAQVGAGPATEDAPVTQLRLEYAALLERLRATPVLVPLGDGHPPDEERGLLTADLNGIRFIIAGEGNRAR
ncbi:hypothetical protein ACH4KN_17065 [Streptomyces sp. NPDC017546]|uniref:hypothetical protein n=1 Tax=unclassified Streptomyces TaxID=2593676 RepID=UPI00235F1BB8|nr:hypothetical protein [Streptomyces sp. MMBL 11-1]